MFRLGVAADTVAATSEEAAPTPNDVEPAPARPPVEPSDWFILVSFSTCAFFFAADAWLDADRAGPLILAPIFLWLFVVILGSAFSVVRHADQIAVRLGEPLGTLVLTMSVTFIEVASISAVMLHGDNNPTLVRDTLLSVIMIVLNGMIGLSLLLGAWRHREQSYNLQGANTYLVVIIPLAVLSLVLPDYTVTTVGPTLSRAQENTLTLAAVGLYCAFLTLQTGRHRGYFTLIDGPGQEHKALSSGAQPLAYHVVMLAAYVAPVAYLAEQLAHPIDYVIETLRVPTMLSGIVIAILVATPEAIGAVSAALANQLQRSVNILLGSVLSSIGLTIPVMLAISQLTDHPLVLGVEHADMVLLVLTLALSMITFSSGRTNVLQGGVHLVLFIMFLLLIVQG